MSDDLLVLLFGALYIALTVWLKRRQFNHEDGDYLPETHITDPRREWYFYGD